MKHYLKEIFWGRYRCATALLWASLVFAMFGLAVQLMEYHMEEGAYLTDIIQYWRKLLLAFAGVYMVFILTRLALRRHPGFCKKLSAVFLVILVGLTIYSIVYGITVDFGAYDGEITMYGGGQPAYLDRNAVMRKALLRCKMFGSAELSSEQRSSLSHILWQWESDAVLPVICLHCGVYSIILYLAALALWVVFAVKCWKSVLPEPKLMLSVEDEETWQLSLPKGLYLCAAAAILMRLLGPVMGLLGICRYSGGAPFANMRVGKDFAYTLTNFIPIAAMAFVLYIYWAPAPEPMEDLEDSAASTDAQISSTTDTYAPDPEMLINMKDSL